MIPPEGRGTRSGGCRGRQTGDETVPAAQIHASGRQSNIFRIDGIYMIRIFLVCLCK